MHDGFSTAIVLMGGWQGSAVIPMELARSGPTALPIALVLVLLRMLLRRRGPATVALVIMLIMTTTGVVNTDSRLSGLAYNATNFPMRHAIRAASHPVTPGVSAPIVPDANAQGLDRVANAALRRIAAGSPRHLAIVEAVRLAYQRAAKAADRADKEHRASRRHP